uniref:Plastid lipid-associated protein/fibrillin conserved domain-containing protein n=1 Tax=Pelagomonas calceolata TaxID=35677 RepID=A0A7S3ZUM2_9STRA|mmetsp:Transcript_26467/g.80289  ORF Transcript_26467/g.80289 Transcript_26467/m.80289 type:complete len:272 (-) Transcript_26467:799-1614(-)
MARPLLCLLALQGAPLLCLRGAAALAPPQGAARVAPLQGATLTPPPQDAAAPSAVPAAPAPITVNEARQQLWAALDSERDVAAAVDRLLGVHQCNYETRAFVEFSLAGAWRLRECVSTKPSREPTKLAALSLERDLVVDEVTQHLAFEGELVNVRHEFAWRRPRNGDKGVLLATSQGTLVESTTRLRTWTLECSDVKHSLHPEGKLTSDAADVVDAVARLAPLELFDPSGTRTDLEYVDPELRLVGVAPGSARGANHVHVWSRDEPWGLAS